MSFLISTAFQVSTHQIVCLFAPGALTSSVYDYILLFWPCLETMSGCVCSSSFRVRNSKRGTISSVAGRKVSTDSVIATDSILGFADSMHGHARIRGRAGKWINGNRTAVLRMFKCLMLFFKAASHFTKDKAACVFEGNSPIQFSPLPGWDMGVTSQYTTLLYKLLWFFRKRREKVVS